MKPKKNLKYLIINRVNLHSRRVNALFLIFSDFAQIAGVCLNFESVILIHKNRPK